MDLEKLFGLPIKRLHIVVAEWPHGRDAFLMAHLLKVATAEPRQTSAIHLGVPAHPVVDARLERLPGLRVIPGLGGDIALLDEHVVRLAVLRFPRHELATLDDQHIHAGVLECPGKGAATHAGADDHDISGYRVLINCDKSAFS